MIAELLLVSALILLAAVALLYVEHQGLRAQLDALHKAEQECINLGI